MEQKLTIMSNFSSPQIHRVFAVLLTETFGEVARCAETYLVGYLLNGLVGGGQQHVALLQTHLAEQLDGGQTGDGLHLAIQLDTA